MNWSEKSFHFRLSTYVNNPYLLQRQIEPASFTNNQRNDEQTVKMSSRYIPLLPKDLCQIPLRSIDDDSLGNMNKRSRGKGRFPFHLPSFLHKRRFFSTKSTSTPTQLSKIRNGKIDSFLGNVQIEDVFFVDAPIHQTESPGRENESSENATNKQSRQRSKRHTATDSVPLVEFHDALSQSIGSNSEIGPHS